MSLLGKLNRIFDKPIKIKFVILFIATVIAGLVEAGSLALTYPLINMIMGDTGVADNAFVRSIYSFFGITKDTSFLALYSVVLAIIYIFRGLYVYLLQAISIRFVARNQAIYSKNILKKVLSFSYLYHTHKNIAEIHRIVNGDVVELFNMMTHFINLLTDFFMSAFMLAYLFYESPIMSSCIVILALLCVIIYMLILRKRIRKAGKMSRDANVAMNKAVFQLFGGIKEVKVLKREKHFENSYVKARDKQVKAAIRFRTWDVIPRHFMEILFYGGAFILMSIFIAIGSDITALIPQLALFVLAGMRIMPAITKQVSALNYILYHRVSIDAVYKNMFEESDIAAQIDFASISDIEKATVNSDLTSGIVVCNLSFKYPKAPDNVLENVSFTIPDNKSVALVGPSGAGKTTLADLILGVLTPDEGTVLYQGKTIYNNENWNKTIGYIPQVIYLLDESILENVAFGIDQKEIDEAKVWHALEQAQLKSFVESLPDGINTVIGDRGIRLSGGQRQRIGIARAIYDDPPVLVLDEATSSLDNETEAAVMEAIMGFHGNKTILIVAHRLSTIEHCDIIYRVEDRQVKRER